MTPFNALAVTLTTTHSDPLGPAVIELGAAGARIDPASDRDPVLDVVFETRVGPGRPMPRHVARADARKSAVRARVEHVFAQQKAHMGLRVRTIGLPRAQIRIGLANLAYSFQRLIFHERRAAAA